MKTDRELLELAAKAADLSGDWSKTIGGWDCLVLPGGHVWQPLHDDGDALRLAVKLGIADLINFYDDDAEDPYAATRRAIVRAAAAMAEMPAVGAA